MDALSKFLELSIKKGLPLASLKTDPQDVSAVVQTFLACCQNPQHPSKKEAEEFLRKPASWLSIGALELLELTNNTIFPSTFASSLDINEVEKAVANQRQAIKEERKRRSQLLEEKARQKKNDLKKDEHFMAMALEQANLAFELDEVPIGAVLVDDEGCVLSKAFNYVEATHDPCGHAEIRVIREGASKIDSHRLESCTLYVTVEPCAMCTGAIINARLSRLVYGIDEPKTGAVVTNVDLLARIPGAKKISVTKGVLADESSNLIKRFFANKRKANKSKK